MTAGVRVMAPAKINWTLEVLGKRSDGYHEIRSVMQTIDLVDTMTLRPADTLTLSITGDPAVLWNDSLESNLAYRAGALLRERCGARSGAEIQLEKRIPVASGLGGGSSDAAAALRGLNRLWKLRLREEDLMAIGAELGSDVPFFIRGGTALASGRGEVLEALPEAPKQRLLLAWWDRPPLKDKTARMYRWLEPQHFTHGEHAERLAHRLRNGDAIRREDLYNVFDHMLPSHDSDVAVSPMWQRRGGPHLCGSGPASFFLLEPGQSTEPLRRAFERLGQPTAEASTVSARDTVTIGDIS